MATLEELLSVQSELDQGASIDELIAVQSELDAPKPNRKFVDNIKEAGELGVEAVSGFNRALAGLVDFVGPNTVDAIAEMVGSEFKSPRLSDLTEPKGAFAGQGLSTDIAAAVGELSALGGATGAAVRGAATLLPRATAGESALTGAARQIGQTTPGAEALAGGLSGIGQEVGRELGGDTGALVGGVAAPTAGMMALQAIAPKFGARALELIDPNTGVLEPSFENALQKRGLSAGSLLDENIPVPRPGASVDEIAQGILVRKLKSGSSDKAVARVRLEPQKGALTRGRRVIPDEIGIEAVKQGFRDGDVAAAKGASQKTKSEMLKMLNMERQILANTKQDFRPTDVAGDHVLSRFNFIRAKADGLRSDLNRIARKADSADPTRLTGPDSVRGLRNLKINTSQIEDNVFSQLDNLGISTSGVPPKLDFRGSDISKDRTSQRMIKDVVDLLAEPGSDAFKAHQVKRQLDNLIDFNKKSARGLTETGKNFAKSVRSSLNNAIRDVSPQYAKVNDELSLAIQTMNDFQRVLGGSIDVFAPGANKAIGQDLRGLLSNRKSRVKLENSINAIDRAAKVLGGDFDVNVKDLVQFSNTLDDRFGDVARTSIEGSVERGVKQAIRGGPGEVAIDAVAKGLEKARGINDKNALNAMQKLLKRADDG